MPDFQAQIRGRAALYPADLTRDDWPNLTPAHYITAGQALMHARQCLRRTWLDLFMPGWSGRPEAKAPF